MNQPYQIFHFQNLKKLHSFPNLLARTSSWHNYSYLGEMEGFFELAYIMYFNPEFYTPFKPTKTIFLP